ncbi:MAG: hypothetical protein LBG27_01705 [Spirochaetaceae bacterium]|jgi:hypothetical protein|nr:hypothetical protein [Spirochaetaceae bacterium]
MKRMVLVTALLAAVLVAALPVFAQTGGGRHQFDLFGGDGYKGSGSTLRFDIDGMALKVSGTASGIPNGGGGYVIDARENLAFSGNQRLIIRVSGVRGTDTFDAFKLLKLELNNAAQTTITDGMKNRNGPTFINARNGEAVFDISRLRNIRKINLVFFNCTVEAVKIEVFYE